MKKDAVKLFQEHPVRSVWDEESEKWWFSVLDVVAILTEQADYTKTRNYWKWLKGKLTDEGSQLVSNTNQLKMVAADGKKYNTDVMDTEQILRLVQSIPSRLYSNQKISSTVLPSTFDSFIASSNDGL